MSNLELVIQPAVRHSDVLRCKYLIAEVYNRSFTIMFSEDIFDLDARIEPYPHRYLMARVGRELVGAMGLYTHNTYIERYGQVTDADVAAMLDEAGVSDRYDPARRREITKLVVKRGWGRKGIAFLLQACVHSRAFLDAGDERPALVTVCATRSVFSSFYDRGEGYVSSRLIKPFPLYEVHSEYRSDDDPMESRLVIPHLDIPDAFYHSSFPARFELPYRHAPPAGATR